MSFGGFGNAPAPAAGGFGFGGGQSAPAPAANAFNFTAQTPAPGMFGAPAAAPSTGFGGFGGGQAAQPAPAPGAFGGFGAPAPAPTAFGGFGTPAPAPTAFGGFGSPAPAPAFGSSFGAAPAPSMFGAPQQQQQQQQSFQYRPAVISGDMPYSQLPDHLKQRFDQLHQLVMNHKRTMNMLATMAPHRLENKELSQRAADMQKEAASLRAKVHSLGESFRALQAEADDSIAKVMAYAYWPIEAIAVRAGLQTTSHGDHASNAFGAAGEEKKDDASQQHQQEFQQRLRAALDRQVVTVDRIDAMPSPYIIATIHDHQARLEQLEQQARQLQHQHGFLQELLKRDNPMLQIEAMAHEQNTKLYHIAEAIRQLHGQLQAITQQYASVERGRNVLEEARTEDWLRERRAEEQAQLQFLKASGQGAGTQQQQQQPTNLFGAAPAPAASANTGTGLFGAPAPAPSAFGFASPAPAAGGAFGGGGFGAAPAPAPAAGGAFGGGGFGAAPAPTPGATGFAFGGGGATSTFGAAPATSASTTSAYTATGSNKKKNSTSRGRRAF